jgi:hypothetical protein
MDVDGSTMPTVPIAALTWILIEGSSSALTASAGLAKHPVVVDDCGCGGVSIYPTVLVRAGPPLGTSCGRWGLGVRGGRKERFGAKIDDVFGELIGHRDVDLFGFHRRFQTHVAVSIQRGTSHRSELISSTPSTHRGTQTRPLRSLILSLAAGRD